MTATRILFLCNQNENRSLTAQHMFEKRKGIEVRSAGFYCEQNRVNQELLRWADAVIVFEECHVMHIKEQYPQIWLDKRIITIDIPDIYNYMEPELQELIRERMKDWWPIIK